MSDLFGGVSTQDTGERSEFDFYETPAFMTRSLLHFEPSIRGATVLECCSGNDAIAHVLRAYGCQVFTNDIDPRHPAQTHFDATKRAYWSEHAPEVEWVVTNTPFGVAFDILQQAYVHSRCGVAFLLRKTFLEPTDDRALWLGENPPRRLIGQPRYPFRGRGSDSVSCDWYLWSKFGWLWSPPIVIDHLAELRVRNEVTE